jgi:hypothetical protein
MVLFILDVGKTIKKKEMEYFIHLKEVLILADGKMILHKE